MKKILLVSTLALFPLFAFASINTPSLTQACGNQTVGLSGNAVSVNVKLDNDSVLDSVVGNWAVNVANVKGGDHQVNTVGTPAEALGFNIPACSGGMNPCQIDGTCPHFGLFAPQIGSVDATIVKQVKVLQSGEGECPAWFYKMTCVSK